MLYIANFKILAPYLLYIVLYKLRDTCNAHKQAIPIRIIIYFKFECDFETCFIRWKCLCCLNTPHNYCADVSHIGALCEWHMLQQLLPDMQHTWSWRISWIVCPNTLLDIESLWCAGQCVCFNMSTTHCVDTPNLQTPMH